MKHGISKYTLFKAGRETAETRADKTQSSARAIVAADAAQRAEKSARLSQLRLEKAAADAATEAETTTAPKKARRSPTTGA